MLYIITLCLLLSFILFDRLYVKSNRRHEGYEAGTIFSGIFTLVAVLFSVGNLATSNFNSIEGYNDEISKEFPTFKGSVRCEGTALVVEGVQQITFTYRNSNFTVPYESGVYYALPGSFCSIGIKPETADIVELLKEDNIAIKANIDAGLNGSINFNKVSEKDAVFIRKIVNTFEQRKNFVLTDTKSGPVFEIKDTETQSTVASEATNRVLKSASSATPKIAVPAHLNKEPVAHKTPTELQELLLKNMSGQ